MMKNRSLLVIAIISLLSSLSVVAQESLTVTGSVFLASDSTAAVGATVRLSDAGGKTLSGTTVREDGRFSASAAPREAVRQLVVTYVGTRPATISLRLSDRSTIDLGRIYLQSDDKVLSEVVAEGSLQQVDKTIVFPTARHLKASPDLLQLLRNLGLNGLSVDLGHRTAQIRGRSIYWMIDGVPKTREDILQLDPKRILRIEYSDLPSLRLLDKGHGGSINVILKERTDGGTLHVSLSAAVTTGFANGQLSSGYHRGRSDLQIDYTGSYRKYPHWQRDQTQTFHSASESITREEKGVPAPFSLLDNSLNLSYSLTPRKGDLLNLTWRNNFGGQGYDMRSEVSETHQDTYRRRSVSRYRGYVPELDAYYKHLLEDGGTLEANLLASMVTGRNERDLTDEIEGKEPRTLSNPIRNRYYSLLGELYYAKRLHPKVFLTTGLQYSYGRAANSYLSSETTDRLDRNNLYLYGQLSGRLSSQLQYSVGTGVKLLVTSSPEERRTFVRNQSSLALYYSPTSDWSLSLSSYYTPILPTLAQLSPVSQRFDRLIVYAGNPQLRSASALNNRLTTNFRRGNFTADLDLHYNHTFSPIYTGITLAPEGGDYAYRPDNGRYSGEAGVSLNLRQDRILGFISLIGRCGYSHFASSVGGRTHRLDDFFWDLSILMQHKDLTLAGYYTDSPQSLYCETLTKPGPSSGLSLIWSRDHLTLYSQVLWLGLPRGDEYHTRQLSPAAPYSQTITIPDNGNMVVLGLTWDLTYGTRKQRNGRSLHNRVSDQSMVKVQD